METAVSLLLVAFSVLLSTIVGLLLVEIVASFKLNPRGTVGAVRRGERGTVAVLIPAHNEAAGIRETIRSIKNQLVADDRLLVVADNCTDDTAVIAESEGAEVLERIDPLNVGKGFALESGIKKLSAAPPDVVVIIDADCTLEAGGLDRLVEACMSEQRPVQALDLMVQPSGNASEARVSEFAWRVKNWVRPLGLKALGLPCQLMGTGMAFPWAVIGEVNVGTGSIVEDLKLGLELASVRSAPLFEPAVLVTSQFPNSSVAALAQRTRWESGHLQSIGSAVPRLLYKAYRSGNLPLFMLAWDAAIPPLSFLAGLLVAMLVASGLAALFGLGYTALLIGAGAACAFAGGVLLAWLRFGRDLVSPHAIFSVPKYIGSKIPIYRHLFSRRGKQMRWARTYRKGEER